MVGYDPKSKVQLTTFDYAVAGGISGAICRACFQPLDVLKIRFQLQVEPIHKSSQNSKYQGLFQAFSKIRQEEGWWSLWKGHIPAQILSVGYGVAQFTSFEILTYVAWRLLPEECSSTYRPITHTICGGLAGCIGTIVIHPVDVIRTRLIAQAEPKVYSGIVDAFTKILRNEGFRGYYKGLVPALSLVGPQMGLQFGFYSLFTSAVSSNTSTSVPSTMTSLLCGTMSGIVAKTVVYPLDVIKKRLQIQGFEMARVPFGGSRIYFGLLHCFWQVLKEEGVKGLYKGLCPSVIKSGSVAGTTFLIYDYICHASVLAHR